MSKKYSYVRNLLIITPPRILRSRASVEFSDMSPL